jgi:hypothetical protein
MKPPGRFYPYAQAFSDDFKITLSMAIERAARRIEVVRPAGGGGERRRNLAADSLADSA